MADGVGVNIGATGQGSISGDTGMIWSWSNGSVLTISGNVLTVVDNSGNSSDPIKTVTATPNDGYVLDHWEYISSSGATPVTLPDGQYDWGYYGTVEAYIYPQINAVFVDGTITQDITLTAGHNYIITSAGNVSSVTLNGNILTISNDSPIDVIDLGAGTRSGGPVVMLSTPDGVQSILQE